MTNPHVVAGRELLERHFDRDVEILRRAATVADGRGGYTEGAESVVATVRGKLAALGPASETAVENRLQGRRGFVFVLPAGTEVLGTDRLRELNGTEIYEVVDPDMDRTDALSRRVIVALGRP